jgi:hypothetical protein
MFTILVTINLLLLLLLICLYINEIYQISLSKLINLFYYFFKPNRSLYVSVFFFLYLIDNNVHKAGSIFIFKFFSFLVAIIIILYKMLHILY